MVLVSRRSPMSIQCSYLLRTITHFLKRWPEFWSGTRIDNRKVRLRGFRASRTLRTESEPPNSMTRITAAIEMSFNRNSPSTATRTSNAGATCPRVAGDLLSCSSLVSGFDIGAKIDERKPDPQRAKSPLPENEWTYRSGLNTTAQRWRIPLFAISSPAGG
jgi:hypothetical protein